MTTGFSPARPMTGNEAAGGAVSARAPFVLGRRLIALAHRRRRLIAAAALVTGLSVLAIAQGWLIATAARQHPLAASAAVGVLFVGFGVIGLGVSGARRASLYKHALWRRRLRDESRKRRRRTERHDRRGKAREFRGYSPAGELDGAARELDEFAYMICHDLQEPLCKQLMFANILREASGSNLDTNARLALDAISSGANRMQALVRDLMSLSRSGRQPLQLESVPLGECVEDAIDALGSRLLERGACITMEKLPVVYGDRGLLCQLFINLLANAAKFTATGVAPVMHVSIRTFEEQHIITVEDNGIGVDPGSAHRIFLPFSRLNPRQSYDGSGLGLSICRKIAERHGGTIWCDSSPGIGSRFSFSLPRNGV